MPKKRRNCRSCKVIWRTSATRLKRQGLNMGLFHFFHPAKLYNQLGKYMILPRICLENTWEYQGTSSFLKWPFEWWAYWKTNGFRGWRLNCGFVWPNLKPSPYQQHQLRMERLDLYHEPQWVIQTFHAQGSGRLAWWSWLQIPSLGGDYVGSFSSWTV